MKISDMIRQALEKKGFKNLKDASKVLGISPELLRVTINKGHIPKDKTLIMIASNWASTSRYSSCRRIRKRSPRK